MTDRRPKQLSRRQALRLAGGAGAAMAVGAGTTHIAAAQPGTATPSPVAQPITIQDTGAQLPSEPVTFRWLDSGDSKATFFNAFFPLYQQAHPNITVDYQGLPGAEIARLVPLGVQSGDAPDVFQVPPGFTPAQLVREGWVRPLDDIIPDFEEWKRRYPPGVLVEGVTMFNGQVYGFPYLSNRQYSTLLLYNTTYMEQAGYDPVAAPLTWDEFRDAARKITEQGQGNYYGLVIPGATIPRWDIIVSNLAEMAGAVGGAINWQTGEYNYTSDQFLAAIELLQALNADGSVFPGSLQLSAPEAEARLPQGVAGICLQGPWNIPQWIRDNPDFQFGVGSQPIPNQGEPLPMGIGPGAFIPPLVYANSEHPEIAGDIFSYLSSVEGQTAFAQLAQGFPPPILPEVRESAAAGLDPRVLTAYDLFERQLRVHPSPAARNPDVAQVTLEMRPITPNLGETVQGLFSGQLDDASAAMQDLRDRADAELERAIEAARATGAEVSRDDWVFPNWDPTQDYTEADYAALPA